MFYLRGKTYFFTSIKATSLILFLFYILYFKRNLVRHLAVHAHIFTIKNLVNLSKDGMLENFYLENDFKDVMNMSYYISALVRMHNHEIKKSLKQYVLGTTISK